MKVGFIVTLLAGMVCFAGVCRAEDKPADTKKQEIKQDVFNTAKQNALKMLDERIQSLQKSRDCVTAAANQDDLKKCREANRKDLSDMRVNHKKQRMDRLDRMEKSLDSKKQRIQEQKKKLQADETTPS